MTKAEAFAILELNKTVKQRQELLKEAIRVVSQIVPPQVN